MSNPPNEIAEAYKSIIDFNKTIISISSSILTGVIAYLVYQEIDFAIQNYIGIILLILSVLLSIKSFGVAIKTVKDSISRPSTIVYANLGAFTLIAGIVAILFIKQQKQTIDGVLSNIEMTTSKFHMKLSPKYCENIQSDEDYYFLTYQIDTSSIEVKYSVKKEIVLSIK